MLSDVSLDDFFSALGTSINVGGGRGCVYKAMPINLESGNDSAIPPSLAPNICLIAALVNI